MPPTNCDPPPPPFQPGQAVEARHVSGFEMTDKLFVPATVRAISNDVSHDSKHCSRTYTVEFCASGAVEDGVPEHFIKLPSERVVFRANGVEVAHGSFGESQALILRFQQDNGLVQAVSLIESSANGAILPHSVWEVNQALASSIALAGLDQHTSGVQKRRVALLGLGAGTLARTMIHAYPDLSIVGAERSSSVLEAARSHFGLSDLPIEARQVDALKLLNEEPKESVDLCIADIASDDAGNVSAQREGGETPSDDVLSFPPEPFTSAAGLREHVLPKLARDGAVAINAMGGRKALLTLCLELEQAFPAVRVIATDPNCIFICSIDRGAPLPRDPREASVTIRSNEALAEMSEQLLSFIDRTDQLASDETLIGYFTPSHFREMLANHNVIV